MTLFPPRQGESVKYFLDNLDRIGQLVSKTPTPGVYDPGLENICVETKAAQAVRAFAVLMSHVCGVR